MYSFEGDFKRRPIQSLGGSSGGEKRDVLLQRAQEERRKREAARKSEFSAQIIQSYFRGFRCRETARRRERTMFDCECKSLQKQNSEMSMQTLGALCRQIIFFFDASEDGQRLVWLCQVLVKQHKEVTKDVFSKDRLSSFRLRKILALCCRFLEFSAVGSTSVAMPLRVLEVYTNADLYSTFRPANEALSEIQALIKYIIQKGYYKCLRKLLEHRIPDSLERTVTPPTPLAASLLELINAPLNIVPRTSAPDFKNLVLRSLCIEFFNQPYTEQIREFLLPALAYSQNTFPFIDLLNALQPICQPQIEENQMQLKSREKEEVIQPTAFLLHSVLILGTDRLSQLNPREVREYLLVLHSLVPAIHQLMSHTQTDDDSDDEDMDWASSSGGGKEAQIAQECLDLINASHHVDGILHVISGDPDPALLTAICTLCHALAVTNRVTVHRSKLMYTLAFNPVFLRNLWHACISVTTRTVTGSQTPLLQSLSRGLELAEEDMRRIVPLLSVFSALFSYSMFSLHDAEFYGDDKESSSKSFMPFSINELITMSMALRDACLGIVELAHPETRPEVAEEYKRAFRSVGVMQKTQSAQDLRRQQLTWSHLFKVLSQLVKQLYARDSRRPFCKFGHWLSPRINIQADQPFQFYKNSEMFQERRFGSLGAFNPDRTVSIEDGPPLSTKEARQLTILQELPFVVAFSERIKIFNRLVQQDRVETQGGEMRHFGGGPVINLKVRRNYLYEDAFERLSVDNEPNLRLRMQVQLMNFAGANEAGIDGGGLFREFIWELMKTAFDPNRGFFKYTTDKALYPNPYARLLQKDFRSHYFFLGRILGKALYEGMLVELPFASFFLSKLLSRHRGDVDIDHLASLDPEVYKNLLFLKTYTGNVADLCLYFTVSHNEFGEVEEEELKPGGKDIPVTNSNRIEYIHMMSDYMLNRRMREQCDAFRNGLADVINMEWLRMFNHNELQVLISGAPVPIDLDDLRRHTNYSGGYTDEHPVIKTFWEVVEDFTEEQKRHLLKFVTSCSRPPLLGFKDLFPVFCVHHAGKDPERLPTASTCMNLLKLPEFTSKQLMQEKLLYAVESGAGFELS